MPESLYATPEELRNQTDKVVVADDPALEDLLRAASQSIDLFTNHPDGFLALATATARPYTGSGTTFQFIGECIAVTLVEVKESVTGTYTPWASTDWMAFTGDPDNPDFNSLPFDALMIDPSGDQSHFTSGKWAGLRGFRPEEQDRGRAAPTVRVTAKWGYAEDVPPIIKTACIAQATIWFKRARSAWGDAAGNPEFGMLFYRKPLDPAIQTMLVESRMVAPAIGVRRK